MMPARNLFLVFFLLTTFWASAQTLPVGMPVLEDAARRLQLQGVQPADRSFLVRPLHAASAANFDSLYAPFGNKTPATGIALFAKGKGQVRLLPVTLRQQYNTKHPYGWNDGALVPAQGYQQQLGAGLFARLGPVSMQVQPEWVYAQNRAFDGFSVNHNDSLWKSYYQVLNRIDNPERHGAGAYTKLFPGQSSLRVHFKKLSLGVSTESLWWGPGIRNALLMSNYAPGFAHLTFNTTAPVSTPVGSFEWQVVAGTLKNSGVLPPDTARSFEGATLYQPKPGDDRYLNGIVFTWQPKWTRGLFLGFARSFYQYKSSVPASLNGYLPVLGAFFKNKAEDENRYGRDQLLSLFARLLLPESGAEFYAEYGRNDHSQNLRDLLLEPEHASAYILGGRKIVTLTPQKSIEVFFELAHLQSPATVQVRELEGWYTHYQVRHGYTHRGQVLGAGIGPGGNSQTLGISWFKGLGKLGLTAERVVHNNDFYYNAFAASRNFSSHWVDLSLNLNRSWQHRRLLYAANLSFIRSYNYQWRYIRALHGKKDVNNLQAQLAVSYLF